MDAIDRNILRVLGEEGKLTQARLAERVGLSLSACQRRVKVLEASGVIGGYRAVVDPDVLGEGFVLFAFVQLASHARADCLAFQSALRPLSPVKEAHHIAGEYDYLLKIAVADMAAYEAFHTDVLADVPGVARIVSHIPMSRVK